MRRILILERDAAMARTLSRALMGSPDLHVESVEIEVTGDPLAALELVKQPGTGFDVCVAGHCPATANAVGFLARVGQFAPDTVRVLMSGFMPVDTVVEAINTAHVDALLVVPWDQGRVNSQFSQILRLRDSRTRNAELARSMRSRKRFEKLPRKSNYRVLIAHTEAWIRHQVRRDLERIVSKVVDIDIVVPSTLGEAVADAHTAPFDLVFLGGMEDSPENHASILRLCSLQPAAARILISGGRLAMEFLDAVNEAHVYHVLKAPWELSELTSTVVTTLAHHQSEQETMLLADLANAVRREPARTA